MPKPFLAIRGLDHVVIRATDIERSLGFYRDVLGCPVERVLEELGLWQLRAGAALVDLVDVRRPLGQVGGPPPGPGTADNVDHICLALEAFDEPALRRHLEAHGVEVGEVSRRYGAEGYGPSVYCRDPDGNVIELKGPPEAHPDA